MPQFLSILESERPGLSPYCPFPLFSSPLLSPSLLFYFSPSFIYSANFLSLGMTVSFRNTKFYKIGPALSRRVGGSGLAVVIATSIDN